MYDLCIKPVLWVCIWYVSVVCVMCSGPGHDIYVTLVYIRSVLCCICSPWLALMRL